MKVVVSLVASAMVVATLMASAAYAQRDAGAKARREYGKGFWNTPSRQTCVVRTYSRPVAAQTATAAVAESADESPATVAQANNDVRRFSYEPTPSDEAPMATIQAPVQTYRRQAPASKPSPPQVRLHPGSSGRRY